MDNLKPLVIVLSRNYSTGLGVIRSLGAAGYTVDLIASTMKKGRSIIASCSKYVHHAVEVPASGIQDGSGCELMEALAQYAQTHREPMVLFPADDFTASVVAKNQELLKEHFLMPEIRADGLNTVDAMDKTLQGNMARSAGLNAPLEWVIDLRSEICIPDDMVYPCFVKPLQSITGRKFEMARCADAAALTAHLTQMQRFFRDRSVLVQEYLEIEKEYDLSGVCLDQEIIIPAVIEKSLVSQYERGVTIAGKMMPADILGDAMAPITDMLRRFHFTGMVDMELILCRGKIYFNEVNFRSGGPSYSYFLSGVNLPALLVGELLGVRHKPEDEKMAVFGKKFVYEKAAWEEYIHAFITRQELERLIAEADFTLLANQEDPQPGRCFQRRIRLSALKHHARSLLGRA
ncbi:MAG: hypothetical protein KBS74_02890 [Clostridiales bacterium]|nr:hypothetical protein [Candidatus Cacconaster stercorequi]